jgi:hypothetical protein
VHNVGEFCLEIGGISSKIAHCFSGILEKCIRALRSYPIEDTGMRNG